MLDRLENKKECIKAGKNPVLYIDYEANTPKMAVESRQQGETDAGAEAEAGAEAYAGSRAEAEAKAEA